MPVFSTARLIWAHAGCADGVSSINAVEKFQFSSSIHTHHSITFTMAPNLLRIAVVLSFFLLLGFQVQADPLIRWVRRLKGCGSISDASPRRGNGVVSAANGQTVWITDDEGALHILDADNHTQDEIYFKPSLVENRWTESRSSVSLFVEPNGTTTEYAVYAVIDVDHIVSNATTSRIIAIYGNGELLGTLKWQVQIEGIVVQTPRIGTDGTRIYATHNDASGRGYFSIIDTEGNRIARQSSPKPFGPLTILSVDGNDELYWGESNGRGYSDSGRIYHHDSTLKVTGVGHEIITSTVVPPVLWREKKRRRMWLGGMSSTMHGWVDGQSFADAPSWSRQLSPSLRNSSYPIATPIASSPDGLRLYVASASTSLYCINAKNGNIHWRAETYDRVFLNGAVMSPDYSSIYSIQHRDGTVEKRSAATGELIWSFNCTSIPGRHFACQDSVEAEFSLSTAGNTLYYVDIWGQVVSLQVDNSPTNSPSLTPTKWPSSRPSISMDQSPSQNDSATSVEPSYEAAISFEPSAEPSASISATPTSLPSFSREPNVEPSAPREPSDVPSHRISTAPSMRTSNPSSEVPSVKESDAPSPYQSALSYPPQTDKPSSWPTNGPTNGPTSGPVESSTSLPPSPENNGDGIDSRAPPRIPATNGTLGLLSGRTETKTASGAELMCSLPLLNLSLFAAGVFVWLIMS